MKLKMNCMKVALVTLGLAAMPSLFAQTTNNTTLTVTVAPEASITVASSPTLTNSGLFSSYVGTTTFTYFVRTTTSGSVTAEVTTAFSGTGSPTTADLSEVASNSGLVGTANTTSTPQSITAAVGVLTFGANASSHDTGDTGTINWTLADRPAYKTGTYSTVVTLTISAT
jgi:hypothetical protein